MPNQVGIPTPARAADSAISLIAANGNGALHAESDWTGEPRAGEDERWSAYRAGVEMAAATLAAFDDRTAEHSDDVVTISEAIADRLNVQGEEREHLAAAARLHDIGKVAVATTILGKPGSLTEEEWGLVREHTVAGQRILSAVPEMQPMARIVRHTHERYDGGGYPDGLAGEQIPLAARIVFCADAFHAIRSDRPYRKGRPALAALEEVRQHSGTQFDPVVVAALCEVAHGLQRARRRGIASLVGGARSRRLSVLLLTLAIGGSAFAATGGFHGLPLIGDDHGSQERLGAPAPNGAAPGESRGTSSGAEPRTGSHGRKHGRGPALRRRGAARRGADASPGVGTDGAPARGSTPASATAPGSASEPARGNGPKVRTKKPKKVKRPKHAPTAQAPGRSGDAPGQQGKLPSLAKVPKLPKPGEPASTRTS